MASKVSATATAKKPAQSFTVRKAADLPDDLDSIKAAAAALDLRAKAVLPKVQLGAAITAKPAESRQMLRLAAIDDEIEALTAALHAEASAIRADLTAAVDSAGSCAIEATAIGLKYCAEPRGGGITVRMPTVGHTLRQIKP